MEGTRTIRGKTEATLSAWPAWSPRGNFSAAQASTGYIKSRARDAVKVPGLFFADKQPARGISRDRANERVWGATVFRKVGGSEKSFSLNFLSERKS